jgi:hypothetical protein
MLPLVGDIDDPALRKEVAEAHQFCKVRNFVIHCDSLIETFQCTLERLRQRARHQKEAQVLAFEPVGGRFLITSWEIFERDHPFELGPEHVLFVAT